MPRAASVSAAPEQLTRAAKDTLGVIGRAPSRNLLQKVQAGYQWLTQRRDIPVDLRRLRDLKDIDHQGYHMLSHRRGILAYDCKFARQNPESRWVDLNGEATDKQGGRIWCRHLAQHVRNTWQAAFDAQRSRGVPPPVLERSLDQARPHKRQKLNPAPQGEPYHHDLKDLKGIAQQPALGNREYEEINWADVQSEIVFRFEEVGHVLQQIAGKLGQHDQCNALLGSTNHLMALKLKRKGDQYSANFYDPNRTAVHKRFVFSNLDAVANLKPTDFADRQDLSDYALLDSRDEATLVLFEPRVEQRFVMQEAHPTPSDVHFFLSNCDRERQQWGAFSKLLRDQVSSESGISHAGRLAQFEAGTSDGIPGLWRAMAKGHHKNVAAFSQLISNERTLAVTDKIALLQAKHPNGAPGLWAAFSNGHADTCHDYVETVLKTEDLSSSQRVALLTAADADQEPGLLMPMFKGHQAVVTDFMAQILSTQVLSTSEKIKLLSAKRPNGTPSVHVGVIYNQRNTVMAYVEAVLAAPQLNSADKMALLEVRSDLSLSLLAMATHLRHAGLAAAITQRILESTALTQLEKVSVLEARDSGDLTLLQQALDQGDDEGVQMILQGFFQADQLSMDKKLDLMAALDETGQMTSRYIGSPIIP